MTSTPEQQQSTEIDVPSAPRWLTRKQHAYGGLAAFVVVVAVPIFGSTVMVLRATEIFVFMVAFAGLHVLSGRLGLMSIGHGAFMGMGGLGAAVAVRDYGLPLLLVPLVGAVVAAIAGGIIAFPSLRLPGVYLALLTVAVAMALPIAMNRLIGPLGVRVDGDLVPPSWTGLSRSQDDLWQYTLVVVVGCTALLALQLVLRGRFGRSLLAVRDEPLAAAAFGINVSRTHLAGVALSSSLAGFAGGLLVYATPFVSGSQYPFELSLSMFALVIAVGASSIWMTVPASILLVLLPVFLVDRGWAIWEPIIYGILLLIMTRVSRGRGVISLFGRDRSPGRLANVGQVLIRRPSIETEQGPGIALLERRPDE
jgi:branched-chain amino acid transport system permease protein